MSTKKKVAATAAAVLIAALLLGGAFAWTDFTQAFTNIFHNHPEPDVLLHDDFTPGKNKDVYVENTGNTPLYVRVVFYEYLQVGNKVVLGNTSQTPAVAVKNKSTYQKHLWTPLPDSTGLQSKWNLPTSQYYDWYLTGAQKLYLPGTSEIDDVDYAALGYSAGDVPSPSDGIKGLSGNGNALQYTEPANSIPMVTMAWFSAQSDNVKACYVGWILDSDGYAYWSQKLMPNTATNLLLDKVLPKTGVSPDDNSYYAIDVCMQAANATEVYKFYDDPTGISPEAKSWIADDALKPAKIGPSLPEKEAKVTGDGLTDAQIAALKAALSVDPVPTDDITALGLNNAKQVYQAAQLAQDALNAEIAKGSPDPALIEQLAREASSLEALGDRMTDANPPDGELPTGTVATVNGNGFAKTVDANNGYTLLNALNFPDPNLLALLTQQGGYVSGNAGNGFFSNYQIHCDSIDTDPAGGDGKLSPTELNAVTSIYLVANSGVSSDPKIAQVVSLEGIELFPNLTTLQVGYTQVSTVRPDQNPQLTTLVVAGNINVVNTTNNPQLQYLLVNNTNVTSLDLSKNTNLTQLTVSNNNKLPVFDVSNLAQLDTIISGGPNTDIIGLQKCKALGTVVLADNLRLQTADFSDFPVLSNLQFQGCTNLTSIDVSNCPNLALCWLYGTATAPMQVSNIDITNTPVLLASGPGFRFQYNGNITITGAAGRTFTDPGYHLAGNVITYAP